MDSTIFKQIPSISEDAVVFTIYPSSNASGKAEVIAMATRIQQYVEELLPNFIWNRDPFRVELAFDNQLQRHFLEGRTRVGDSVDDEWGTVWLLRMISEKWDVAVSASDGDGDFILIEAANELPSWAQPSNSENRVWIYQSKLHLVPLQYTSKRPEGYRSRDSASYSQALQDDDPTGFISVEEALKLVRDDSVNTLAPNNVARLVWARISGYPAAARLHIHRTKCWLPADIAKALIVNPQLVQKAVEAFYTRDALQLRLANRMSRFPPHTSVLTTVAMTRTAYAQLAGQKFFPPKIFGKWTEAEGSAALRWKDIGMKLACGFEMLYQESKDTTRKNTLSHDDTNLDALRDAIRRDADFTEYMNTLQQSTYFRGELEGSYQWNALEEKAIRAYAQVRSNQDTQRTSFRASFNRAVGLAQKESNTEDDDSEDWLTIDAANFDEYLENVMGRNSSQATPLDVDDDEERMAQAQAARLQDLASKVEDFVEGEGDIDGARFADDLLSDSDSDSDIEMGSPANKLVNATDSERKIAMDRLVAALPKEDYGKMPSSYHRNSQRTKLASEDKEETPLSDTSKPQSIRPPIIPRDEYDGVIEDDSEDEDFDSEEEEDQPQVVGDVEIDMDEEEEEFLEFSRQALGISDEQWNDIIKDRKQRGAFLPDGAKPIKPQPPSKSEPTLAAPAPSAPPPLNATGMPNPELDSFESVMQAMEDHLAQIRASAGSTKPAKASRKSRKDTADTSKTKGKKSDPGEEQDIESAMDAELQALLQGGGDDDDEQMDSSLDYNLIKNFLESFKSQGGLSGPVSNLAGRLQPELKLPRDT